MQDTPHKLIYYLLIIYECVMIFRYCTKKYSKSKYDFYVQDVDNETGDSASFKFSVGSSKRILSRSNNLRFTVKPDDRYGDDIEFNYLAVAGRKG